MIKNKSKYLDLGPGARKKHSVIESYTTCILSNILSMTCVFTIS